MSAGRMNYEDHRMEEKLMTGDAVASELHKRKFNWISSIITSVSNFSVQYNFQAISIALLIMSVSECTTDDSKCRSGEQESWVSGTATATVFAGAITGQLSMGYAGDILGRDKAMVFTLSLASLAALCSSLLPMGSPTDVYLTVIIFRFILGVGLGGVYPLSATKAAEDAGDGHGHVDTRAASYSFFWQNPGAMTPWLIGYLVTFQHISSNTFWRLILGLGFIPGLIVVIGSIMEQRAKKNTANKMSTVPIGSVTEKPQINVKKLLSDWRIIKKLIATGGGWFIYDVAYYGVSLFGGSIIREINTEDDDNVSSYDSIHDTAGKQLIALGMAIPACLLTIYLLKFVSTKNMQIYGFLFIAVMFALMAIFFERLNGVPLFIIYCGLLFSLSFGPNVTTFILPAETFPQNVRATMNGISSACGKLGAVTGAYMFGPLAKATSYVFVMSFCCVLSVVGAVFSYYFIDDTNVNTEGGPINRSLLGNDGDDDDTSEDRTYNVS